MKTGSLQKPQLFIWFFLTTDDPQGPGRVQEDTARPRLHAKFTFYGRQNRNVDYRVSPLALC